MYVPCSHFSLDPKLVYSISFYLKEGFKRQTTDKELDNDKTYEMDQIA